MRTLNVCVAVMLGARVLYAAPLTPECFIVSGLAKDELGTFGTVKEKITGQKRCKVVSAWKDVVPSSPKGTPVFVVQATHGVEGGKALSDAEDESGEAILAKMKGLAKTGRPLGVFSYECFSGDLMAKFLLAGDPVFNNTCLIVNSVPNRTSLGGYEIKDVQPWSLPLGQNLNELFRTQKQGMSSGSAWEGNGYIDLMMSRVMNESLLGSLESKLKPVVVGCNMDRARKVGQVRIADL